MRGDGGGEGERRLVVVDGEGVVTVDEGVDHAEFVELLVQDVVVATQTVSENLRRLAVLREVMDLVESAGLIVRCRRIHVEVRRPRNVDHQLSLLLTGAVIRFRGFQGNVVDV